MAQKGHWLNLAGLSLCRPVGRDLQTLISFPCVPQDYRPGVTRAQLEEEQRRQRIRDGLEPEASAADQRRSGPEFNDGSFSRSGEYRPVRQPLLHP